MAEPNNDAGNGANTQPQRAEKFCFGVTTHPGGHHLGECGTSHQAHSSHSGWFSGFPEGQRQQQQLPPNQRYQMGPPPQTSTFPPKPQPTQSLSAQPRVSQALSAPHPECGAAAGPTPKRPRDSADDGDVVMAEPQQERDQAVEELRRLVFDKTKLSERLKQERDQAVEELRRLGPELKEKTELTERLKQERDQAVEELRRLRPELKEKTELSERLQADLHRTRSELRDASAAGTDIAGTFPTPKTLGDDFTGLVESLSEAGPEEPAELADFFKQIFGLLSDHCNGKLKECFANIRSGLELDESDEGAWKQVEGFAVKAVRLRRSVIFSVPHENPKKWIEHISSNPEAYSKLAEKCQNYQEILDNIPALLLLMGCCSLSQPPLHLKISNIGTMEEYSDKLHKIMDGGRKPGELCTVILPPLYQDKSLLCRARALGRQE